MAKEKEKMLDWYRIITLMEKSLLVVIAFLTAYAVIVEMFVVLSERAVKLTDLLLLFIYAEVLGMVAAFAVFTGRTLLWPAPANARQVAQTSA